MLNAVRRDTREYAMNKLLAEFLGTFFFCAAALLSGNPLAAAGALAALSYALGYVSGGHFNPAVSVAVWMRGQIDRGEMFRYLAAQAVGGITGFLLYKLLAGSSPSQPWEGAVLRTFMGESCFTFLVAFTFLHVRTARQQLGNAYSGAAIGLAHYAGASALSRVSAGACNPALGLAFALAGYVPAWMIIVYVFTGLLGGVAAAIAYRLLNPND